LYRLWGQIVKRNEEWNGKVEDQQQHLKKYTESVPTKWLEEKLKEGSKEFNSGKEGTIPSVGSWAA